MCGVRASRAPARDCRGRRLVVERRLKVGGMVACGLGVVRIWIMFLDGITGDKNCTVDEQLRHRCV